MTATKSATALASLFMKLLALVFGLLALVEIPHLGVNARLHWDAETSISNQIPTPGRDTLATARGHIYDIVTVTGTTDPAEATRIFNDPAGHFDHNAIETVRLYYTQVSFAISAIVLNTVGRWTGSPVDAVLAFQLAGTLAMSIPTALLLTVAIAQSHAGPDRGRRLRMLFLATVVVVSSPVFLSLARQLLTETVGFLWLVPSLMLVGWGVNPRRSTPVAVTAAAVAAGGLLLTIRTRYSLGPAIGLLLPMFLIPSVGLGDLRRRAWHYTAVFVSAISFTAALIAIDAHFYGPMIFPWVYDETLVRSARLFFHSSPPYKMFFLMLYENAAMVLPPGIVMVALVAGGGNGAKRAAHEGYSRNKRSWRRPNRLLREYPPCAALPDRSRVWQTRYAAVAFAVLLILIDMTARQQVGFQGRHLFALSVACTILMLLTIGRVQWTRFGGRLFTGICLVLLAMNLLSDFWFQRTNPLAHGRRPQDDSFVQRFQKSHPTAAIPLVALAAYYEWADEDRLHDGLVATEYLHDHQSPGVLPLLLTDPSPDDGRWWAGRFATRFGLAEALPMNARFDPLVIAPVRAAIQAGRPVYLFTASRRPVCPIFQAELTGSPAMHTAALYRVTAVENAGYLAAANGTASPPSDPIRITCTRGVIIRHSQADWVTIDQISPEDIKAFADPQSVRFRIDGIDPAKRYRLELVTWDPDQTGARMKVLQVDQRGPTILNPSVSGGAVPAIVSMSLVQGTERSVVVSVQSAGGNHAEVCEIWVREVRSEN